MVQWNASAGLERARIVLRCRKRQLGCGHPPERRVPMRSDVPKLLAFAASMALVACAGSPDVPSSIQAKELHFTEMDDNMDQRLVPREIETHLLLYRDFARFDSDDN